MLLGPFVFLPFLLRVLADESLHQEPHIGKARVIFQLVHDIGEQMLQGCLDILARLLEI